MTDIENRMRQLKLSGLKVMVESLAHQSERIMWMAQATGLSESSQRLCSVANELNGVRREIETELEKAPLEANPIRRP